MTWVCRMPLAGIENMAPLPLLRRACILLLVLAQGVSSADFVGCSLGDFNDMAKQTGNHDPKHTQVPFAYQKKLEGVDENLSGITYFPSSNTLIGIRHKPPAIFEISLAGKVRAPCFPSVSSSVSPEIS